MPTASASDRVEEGRGEFLVVANTLLTESITCARRNAKTKKTGVDVTKNYAERDLVKKITGQIGIVLFAEKKIKEKQAENYPR